MKNWGDLIKMLLNHCFVTGRQGIEKNLKIVGFFIHDSNGVGFQITVEHDKMTGIFQGIKNFYSLGSKQGNFRQILRVTADGCGHENVILFQFPMYEISYFCKLFFINVRT